MAEPGVIGRTPYKDRQVGLVLFGILEILIGLFFLLALVLGALGSALGAGLATTLPADQQAALSPRAMLPSLVFDLLLAVGFIWLGVGSILARRWARTLLLVVSWLWLLAGLAACLALLVVFPGLLDRALQGGAAAAPGADAMAFMKGCLAVVFALFYIVLPLVLVLFYRSRNVKATCEARDPKPRWTDRCPTPVLALSLALGAGAASLLVTALYGALPLFGRIVSGPLAAAIAVGVALLLAVLARETYRLRPWSWWAVLVLALAGNVSSAVTLFSSLSWAELYREMGMPAARIERLGLDRMLADPRLFWFYLIFAVAALGYLVWVKRFFHPAAGPADAAAAGPAPAAGPSHHDEA